jgi:putative DNA primase/helicase
VSQHAEFEIPSGLPDIVALGTQLWGEPTKRTPDKVEFGARGSKCVQPAPANTWFDHEANKGGGYLDLYRLNYGKLPDLPGFPIPPGMARELSNPVAWWDYQAASGRTIARVVRFHPPGRDKTYRQFRRDGDRWRAGMKGLELPLYHLPELLQAPDGSTVCVTEGEKHADQIRAWGMLATSNAGGAKKFRPRHAAVLARFDCVILPDNDQAGREHAEVVASALRAAGCGNIRVLNLPKLPPKGDASIGCGPAARPQSSLSWLWPRRSSRPAIRQRPQMHLQMNRRPEAKSRHHPRLMTQRITRPYRPT